MRYVIIEDKRFVGSFCVLPGCGIEQVSQMPNYPDTEALEAAEAELKGYSPLVFAGEVNLMCTLNWCTLKRFHQLCWSLRTFHFLFLS